MAKKLIHTLKSQVRVNEHKEQMVFDEIHVLLEHEGFSNAEIVRYLAPSPVIENEKEALRWLRRYKEKKMLESKERYLKEQAQLSGEIEEINKTLAKMCNRIEDAV